MKLIIAGSRTFDDYNLLKTEADKFINSHLHHETDTEAIEIVSGTARGADKLGEKYAYDRGLRVKQFVPNWAGLGPGAGFRRNESMAKYASHLLAFWDGESHGTQHMINTARAQGLSVEVVKFGKAAIQKPPAP